jgi:hypothetical protein
MFSLTLRDHLLLTFGQVIHRHKVHTQAARSYSRWNRLLRGCEALLLSGVTIASVGTAFGRGPVFAIITAVMAGVALLVLLIHLTFDFETLAHAHGACSARLWQIRERYRALLSDLHDGVLSSEEARLRRDDLMDELRAIYENAPPPALAAYQAARKSLEKAEEPDLSDEEIGMFPPKSVHKAS